jgi:hypothetical protein
MFPLKLVMRQFDYKLISPVTWQIEPTSPEAVHTQQSTLTYSIIWAIHIHSASQRIPRLLWKPKVHYRIHKSPPPEIDIRNFIWPLKSSGSIRTTHFSTLNLSILPTECICVFRMFLAINSDCFPKPEFPKLMVREPSVLREKFHLVRLSSWSRSFIYSKMWSSWQNLYNTFI